MDFTLSPEIENLRVRTRAFVEEHVLPLEADPANFSEHENIPRRAARAGAREGQGGRAVGAAVAQGIRRHGAADRRLGGDVRGGGALAVRAARLQLHGAGRRQHEPAQAASARRRRRKSGCGRSSKGKVRSSFAMTEPAPGGGSDPEHDQDLRREEGRQVGDPRPQVVHHRRRRRRAFHPRGAHLRRQAQGHHHLPLSQGPARLAHRAAHRDHGAGGARRPLRAGVRRPRSARRRRARRRRRRAARWCRSGSVRRGSRIACAGSAGPSAAWRSRRSTSTAARASASSSPTARACRSSSARSPTTSRSGGCSPCTRPGSSTRATAPARKCRWPRCTSPTRCTRPPTSRSSSTARAAIPRTRWWNGSTAPPAPRAWSTAPTRCTRWCWRRFMREEGRDFWSWSAGNRV